MHTNKSFNFIASFVNLSYFQFSMVHLLFLSVYSFIHFIQQFHVIISHAYCFACLACVFCFYFSLHLLLHCIHLGHSYLKMHGNKRIVRWTTQTFRFFFFYFAAFKKHFICFSIWHGINSKRKYLKLVLTTNLFLFTIVLLTAYVFFYNFTVAF